MSRFRYYPRQGIFWGLLLILFGIWFIIRPFIPLHMPTYQLILAIVFIFIGLQILFGGTHFRRYYRDRRFDREYHYDKDSQQKEYNFSFTSGNIDLTGYSLKDSPKDIFINVSFGGGEVLLDGDLSYKITATASFGGVSFPDGSGIGFGSSVYKSPGYNKDQFLDIEVHVSFGGLRFITANDK